MEEQCTYKQVQRKAHASRECERQNVISSSSIIRFFCVEKYCPVFRRSVTCDSFVKSNCVEGNDLWLGRTKARLYRVAGTKRHGAGSEHGGAVAAMCYCANFHF